MRILDTRQVRQAPPMKERLRCLSLVPLLIINGDFKFVIYSAIIWIYDLFLDRDADDQSDLREIGFRGCSTTLFDCILHAPHGEVSSVSMA